MTPFLLQPATDWTGQTHEERLRLCLEAAYVHDLIPARIFNQATAKLAARADLQREQRAACGRKEPIA